MWMRRGYFIAMFLLIAGLLAKNSYSEWDSQSCGMPHRIPVTITAGAIGHSNETRIDLVNADFPASYIFSAAGHDIRVYAADDVTPVEYVVTGWDTVARMATIFVKLPAMAPAESQIVYIYFDDGTLLSADNAPFVFPDVGMRIRSRVSTADPISPADAITAFENATIDVTNSVRPTITGTNNRSYGGTNGDYGWCVSAVLNVTSSTSGVWGFRYGGDFGRGGHLYIRGQELEQQWNDDLWWANSYANPAEVLEGTINLPVGWHRYEALGFEGCCDGPTGFQARPPGGVWQDLSSANFPLRAAQCIADTATVSVGASQSCSTELIAEKTVAIDSSSVHDFAIPGSIVKYDIQLTNPGQAVDGSTLVLTDVLPSEVDLVVTGAGAFAFTDGAISSGLSLTYSGPTSATDDVLFSTDGIDFSYSPIGSVDPAITHVRFTPQGIFNPNDAGATPNFTITILAQIK